MHLLMSPARRMICCHKQLSVSYVIMHWIDNYFIVIIILCIQYRWINNKPSVAGLEKVFLMYSMTRSNDQNGNTPPKHCTWIQGCLSFDPLSSRDWMLDFWNVLVCKLNKTCDPYQLHNPLILSKTKMLMSPFTSFNTYSSIHVQAIHGISY